MLWERASGAIGVICPIGLSMVVVLAVADEPALVRFTLLLLLITLLLLLLFSPPVIVVADEEQDVDVDPVDSDGEAIGPLLLLILLLVVLLLLLFAVAATDGGEIFREPPTPTGV